MLGEIQMTPLSGIFGLAKSYNFKNNFISRFSIHKIIW